MTDTMTSSANPMEGISVTPEALRAKVNEILELDEQLAAASGSTALGKRALANSITSEREGVWRELVDAVVNKIAEAESDNEALVALVTALDKGVTDRFGKQVDEFLQAQVEANSSEQIKLSDDELQNLTNHAKELRKQEKALREILVMFGMNVDDIPEPKRLTGSRGKRGPRVFSRYNYSVDGQPRTESQNSLSSIANTVAPDDWNTPKLREFISSQGIDINNPPDEWSVTLPNGKVVSAVKKSVEDVYETSDDDDGDEDETENE